MTRELVTAPSGISYPVWWSGAGTPLLLLHGFTGSHETWEHLVACLAESRLCMTLDLPGHGESALPQGQDWDFATVVDDLAWLIESMPGGKADVLGYSMGGRLALALAVTHPERVRTLILESSSPGIAGKQERRTRRDTDEQLASRILSDGLDAFVAHWERLPMWASQAGLPEPVREQQRRIRLSHSLSGLAANLRATGTGAQPSYWERLAGVKAPALLIAGELDQKFALIGTRMQEDLPDVRLEIVPDAGHAVHLEQPDRYVQLVAQFLEQSDSIARQTEGNDRD